MALLSTGNPKLSERGHSGRAQQEKCCQGELRNPIQETLDILCDVDHAPQNFQPRDNLDENFVSLEEGLKFLDGAQCSNLGIVSPFSDYSSDSGVIGGSVSPFIDDQNFLAGVSDLFDDTSSCVSLPNQLKPSSKHLTASCAKTAEVSTDRSRKNADAARQNRIKKKKYLEKLEKDRSNLKTENVVLKTRCREYQTKCQGLQAEVDYLKNVLANDSSLVSLIKNIPCVPNIKLTSSFLSRKRSSPGMKTPENSKKSKTENCGVCLHVSKDTVSLEFCNKCSVAAQS